MYLLVSENMYTSSLFAKVFLVSASMFHTIYCKCGETYLRTCQSNIHHPTTDHISATKAVENYMECIDLCNSNKNECRSFDIRSLNNGSYTCQMFNTLGRSNCAVTPRAQHYVRVNHFSAKTF